MTNTELKAYIKSKLSFEDEKVLEEVTKRIKKVLENWKIVLYNLVVISRCPRSSAG